MTHAPDALYLTEVDYEDPEYPLVWASTSEDSGGVKYTRADLVAALVEAATPFYAAVFNDNGDVTISTGHLTTADWLKLDAALAALKGGDA